MKVTKVTFDKSVKQLVLDIFDKTIDSENYIVEKSNSKRILTTNDGEISIDKFGGVMKGSEIFLRSDLPTYMEIADKQTQ